MASTVRIPIESTATKIIKAYNGDNDYILYYKKTFKVYPYYVIGKEIAKYVIKNQNINPTIINKRVNIHPYSAAELQAKFKTEKTPDSIFINKTLAVDKDVIHIWGKFFDEDPYYQSIFITKSAFVKNKEFYDIKWEKYDIRPPKPHQKPAIEKLVTNSKFILADDMGLGKALGINELVYTPTGKVKMGDLKVGDNVIGSDGKKTKVLEVHPQPIKEMFKITFNDGYSTTCCKEHIWTVMSNNGSVNHKHRPVRYTNLTVEQMLDKGLELEQRGFGWNEKRPYKFKSYYKQSNGQNKWQIPIVKPIKFENEYKLPIEPYLLGVSLGDGHITKKGVIRIAIDKDDFDEIFDKQILNEISKQNNVRVNAINSLKEEVIKLKLNGTLSHTKFIPKLYKFTSVEDRLSILQGLMDTDGYCMKSENDCFGGTEYCSVSEQLADDVAEIVHSLGGIVKKKSKIGSYKKSDCTKVICRRVYRLNIKLPEGMNPFRLKRKANEYNPPKKYKVGRYIKSIESVGDGDSVCIKVDAEDSLFVINHGIVTHNTVSAIIAAKEIGAKSILIVCPATVKLNWKKEIEFYEDSKDIAIINGTEWKSAKWVIINYDILRNFHHLPQRGVKASDLPITPIQMAKFDLVIADEAHKLKDAKSNRSKIFNNFVQDIPNRWLLTGTPIVNKPIDYFNLLQICDSPLSDNWQRYVKTYCDGKQYMNKQRKRYWVTGGHSNISELKKYSQNLIFRRLKTEVADLPDKIIRPIYLPIESTVMYDQYMKEYKKWLIEMDDKGEEIPAWNHLTQLIKVRQMLSLDKINSTVELANDLIEQGKKVVIFSCFTETLNHIVEAFGKIAVKLDGTTSQINRQRAVDSFQENNKIKVFCANIIAGGVGITLTAGEVVIFNDLDWVPANHVQAEDRCLRIGQENNVNVFYPLIDETLDVIMFEALTVKKSVINAVLGDTEEAFSETMVKYVIEKIKHQGLNTF